MHRSASQSLPSRLKIHPASLSTSRIDLKRVFNLMVTNTEYIDQNMKITDFQKLTNSTCIVEPFSQLDFIGKNAV